MKRPTAGTLLGLALALPAAAQAQPVPAPAPRSAPASAPTSATASAAASAPATRPAPPPGHGVNDWCPPPARLVIVFKDDFSLGLDGWRLEAQDPRSSAVPVNVGGRTLLDVQAPAGLTLWLLRELKGDYAIRFTAIPQPAPEAAGELSGRISDLNMFWNAAEADGSAPRVRDGAFASYDKLRAAYVGFGANGNRTTRLRSYDGSGRRDLLNGFADPPEADVADRLGAMKPHTRLQAGKPVLVQILSRQPTEQDLVYLRWWANGRLLFEQSLLHAGSRPSVPLAGHFGFRTTTSRFQLANFRILHCKKDSEP